MLESPLAGEDPPVLTRRVNMDGRPRPKFERGRQRGGARWAATPRKFAGGAFSTPKPPNGFTHIYAIQTCPASPIFRRRTPAFCLPRQPTARNPLTRQPKMSRDAGSLARGLFAAATRWPGRGHDCGAGRGAGSAYSRRRRGASRTAAPHRRDGCPLGAGGGLYAATRDDASFLLCGGRRPREGVGAGCRGCGPRTQNRAPCQAKARSCAAADMTMSCAVEITARPRDARQGREDGLAAAACAREDRRRTRRTAPPPERTDRT